MDTTAGDVVCDLKTAPPPYSQRGYDRLAPLYQTTEWLVFGKRLQQARLALLAELPPWSRLLLFGDGDGRLLAELCAQIQKMEQQSSPPGTPWKIVSVDHSPAMLRQQQSRVEELAAGNHVEFLQANACSYLPEANAYDVLITPFFLDCFSRSELERYLPSWLAALRHGGSLYYVDFVVPHEAWQRPWAILLLRAMHLFFRWQTGLQNRRLVDPQPLFLQCGLRKVAERFGVNGMVVSQLWQQTLRVTP